MECELMENNVVSNMYVPEEKDQLKLLENNDVSNT